jgi:putative RNA 2'-phosphotransferase
LAIVASQIDDGGPNLANRHYVSSLCALLQFRDMNDKTDKNDSHSKRQHFDSASLISTSKFLSLVLRHKPEAIGLSLDTNGWADIDDLLARARPHRAIDRALLDAVVAGNDKQRFAISADGLRIRANQGHSVTTIELGLNPSEPPAVLYHGTATRFVESIRREGLKSGSRRHVHLSRDLDTAIKVGSRHGTPQVLRIDAAAMTQAGHAFYVSENGVWLTDAVPPRFIDFSDISAA